MGGAELCKAQRMPSLIPRTKHPRWSPKRLPLTEASILWVPQFSVPLACDMHTYACRRPCAPLPSFVLYTSASLSMLEAMDSFNWYILFDNLGLSFSTVQFFSRRYNGIEQQSFHKCFYRLEKISINTVIVKRCLVGVKKVFFVSFHSLYFSI